MVDAVYKPAALPRLICYLLLLDTPVCYLLLLDTPVYCLHTCLLSTRKSLILIFV
jgi:hypothetical protein